MTISKYKNFAENLPQNNMFFYSAIDKL